MGDNGKIENVKKPSDAGVPIINPDEKQQVNQQPKLLKLIEIFVDEKGQVYAQGEIEKKELCLNAIAETIKLVANWKTQVVVPQRGTFIQGVRNFLAGRK